MFFLITPYFLIVFQYYILTKKREANKVFTHIYILTLMKVKKKIISIKCFYHAFPGFLRYKFQGHMHINILI